MVTCIVSLENLSATYKLDAAIANQIMRCYYSYITRPFFSFMCFVTEHKKFNYLLNVYLSNFVISRILQSEAPIQVTDIEEISSSN